MKISNSTKWNTAQLRKILTICLARYRQDNGDGALNQLKASKFEVSIVHSTGRLHSSAVPKLGYVSLYMPNSALSAVDAATNFMLSLDICAGFKATNIYRTFIANKIHELPLTYGAVKKFVHPLQIATNAAMQKRKDYERAVASVKLAETRLKRATTTLKNRTKKVKRLARQLGIEMKETQ